MGFAPTDDESEEALLKKIYGNVPEYRKRSRRAKALRSRQERMQAMADAEISLGGVTPTTNGGLFQTQGTYIPNYSGMAQKAMGALGAAYGERKGGPLEQAEGDADTLQSEQLLEQALILGRRARARRKASGYDY
jgi:hypothetical protein